MSATTSIDQLLVTLRELNIIIQVDNEGKLDVKSPVGVLTPQIIDQLKNRKEELLDYFQSVKVYRSGSNEIPAAPRADAYPLSSSQMRLWITDKLSPGSAAYNVISVFTLNESLLHREYERAIRAVIERHEILRTVFREEENGDVRQYILDAASLHFELPLLDLTAETNAGEKADELIRKDKDIPFVLSRYPLFRTMLFRLDEEKYLFYFAMHHIISDGWSMTCLAKDVSLFYDAYKQNRTPELPPLRIQYKDYAVWQQQQLAAGMFKEHREYWLGQFSGELPVLHLPADKIRPPLLTRNGYRVTTLISGELAAGLVDLCKKQNGTLFMGLLAALKILFYRYTGQNDIVIGSPVAGRQHTDLENQIGFYINTLALRTRFNGNDNFLDMLKKVQDVTLSAYAHQMYPIDRLIEELDFRRDMSRSALFDVVVALQNQYEKGRKPKINSVPPDGIIDEEASAVKFDLHLDFREVVDGIYLDIEYNTDIYDRENMVRLIDHYKRLLAQVILRPEAALDELDYLGPEEQAQLLTTFNDTDANYPLDKTIVELFEMQATLTPDATALVYGRESLNYRALDEQSNQLAHYLQKKGVREESLVPVCLDRSLEMVISILGILKAGGAYVPIDPSYPQERIAYILADIGASFIITHTDYRELFETGQQLFKFFADRDWIAIDMEPSMQVTGTLRPDHLAYVIYTSGSTGKPKGVMIEHASVVNLSLGQKDLLGLQPGMGTLQFASFGFDASCYEIFNTLLSGGRLILPMNEEIRVGRLFSELVNRNHVQVAVLPPSFQHVIIKEELPALKTIVSAGEPLNIEVAAVISAGNIRLINAYGPTETTVCATLTADPVLMNGKVTIGKPVPNTQIYILDGAANLMPVGVPGELCIGGAGLARGYLNRETLTAEKFIKNPYIPGTRLYRTGDLARWLPDGNIEYLGRIDDQVKIRGYRIELGEISHALSSLDGISSSAVVARSDEDGQQYLAGYYVSGQPQLSSLLRQQLLNRLPEYMVPAYLVQLENMPLTPSGKIDRKSLPDPVAMTLTGGAAYMPPRSGTEEKIIDIWKDILKYNGRIGIEDNFFDLGGHSLRMMQLVNHYYRAFEVKLPLQELFEHTSVASHAKLIAEQSVAGYDHIAGIADADDYAVSDGQRRIWILSQMKDGSLAYHLSGQLLLEGNYSAGDLEAAIRQTIARHEILRTVFRENDRQELRQVVLPPDGAYLILDYQDFEGASSATVQAYISAASCRPFDLQEGPLLRAGLIRSDAGHYIFHYTMHHIISDAWSMELLSEEVLTRYKALSAGKVLELQPLPIQYRDYAAWQQQLLLTDRFKAHLAYWMEQLSGVLPVLDLPSNKIRPGVMTHNAQVLSVVIDEALTEGLRALCRQQQATLFMGLLAALKALCFRYTGLEDIIIGSPLAGREHVDLEDQIGFYLNTLPLRTRFNGNHSFTELLKHVRSVTLAAYEHQMYPFDRLIEELQLKRNTSRAPFFDILLDVHNIRTKGPAGNEGVFRETRILDRGCRSGKYDLSFVLEEAGDRLYMEVEFNRDIYDKADIVRLIEHYLQLLRSAITDPGQPLHCLHYLTADETQQLLLGFNDTATGLPAEGTVLDLLAMQVNRSPEAIAVVYGQEKLSYRELDEQSNQFARYLQKKGVKAETLVPICVDRSPEMIISILGILKAGGAFVPVDPSYPRERIAYILSDLDARFIITHTDHRELFGDNEQVFTFFIDRDWLALQLESPDRLTTAVRQGQLAYVIYTSGSAGRPKGVLITHKSLHNYMQWVKQAYLTEDDEGNWGLYSSLSFDLTITSLFGAFINGKQLYVFPQDMEISQILSLYLDRESGLDVIKLTPAHIMLIEAMELEKTGIRKAIVGGEQLYDYHVAVLKTLNPDMIIYNEYGPTEATVGSSVAVITNAETPITIGRPIINTSIYILDTNGGLLPVAAAGELCIGGAGLASGYLHKDELTREKFIPHPWQPGERLYRTGDLARRLPDGALAYIGRIDDQVKIRGFRIEPEEVSHALAALEDITAAVVVARVAPDGQQYLAGYFVSEQQTPSSLIRQGLLDKLPEYMIPDHLLQLDSLPLTMNGKIDRKALPDPLSGELMNGYTYIAPRTQAEKDLVALYQQAFKRDRVGIRENFFELGGNSMKAVWITGKLRQLGYEVNIEDILNDPVLEDLGCKISKSRMEGQAELYGLSFNQQLYLGHNGITHSTGSFYYHLEGFEEARFLKAYKEVLAHTDMLRVKFSNIQGNVYQQVLPADQVKHIVRFVKKEMVDFNDPDLIQIRKEMTETPFDLYNGETMRCAVLQSKEEAYVFIVIHHIVTDQISNRILKDLLTDAYYGRELNCSNSSYLDFIAAQQQYLTTQEAKLKIQYWKGHLGSITPALAAGKDHSGETDVILNQEVLSGKTFEAIVNYCKSEHIFLSAFILGVYGLLISSEYPDQQQFLLEVVVNGRDVLLPGFSTDDIIGQFTNGLPLKFSSDGRTPGEVLKHIQQVYMNGRINQEIHYNVIKRLFSDDHQVDLSEVIDLSLNYAHFSDQYLDSSDESYTAKGSAADMEWSGRQGKMFIKCYEYKNGIRINWQVKCSPQMADAFSEKEYYLDRLRGIIYQVLQKEHIYSITRK